MPNMSGRHFCSICNVYGWKRIDGSLSCHNKKVRGHIIAASWVKKPKRFTWNDKAKEGELEGATYLRRVLKPLMVIKVDPSKVTSTILEDFDLKEFLGSEDPFLILVTD